MRLFVALELPDAARTALAAWAQAAAPPAARRVPAGDLHVTLAFLGSRSEDHARAAGELLDTVARRPGELRTAGALWLPPRRPGVLAVALRAPAALVELQLELVAALAEQIGHAPERRPFRAHATVARLRRGARVDSRRRLDPPVPELAFAPPALTLYRSRTGPDGARYEPLRRTALA